MCDDNKTFKSKTIEFLGKHYEVKHKTSGSLNNKYFITFGLIKFYTVKFYNEKIFPFVNFLGFQNINDFFVCSAFLCFIYIIIGLMFVFVGTAVEHDKQVHSCIKNGCSIVAEHCANKIETDLNNCIKQNINDLQIIKNQYSSYNNWFVYISLIMIFSIGIVLLLSYLYEKIIFQVKKVNDQIPEIEEV